MLPWNIAVADIVVLVVPAVVVSAPTGAMVLTVVMVLKTAAGET
jgi:hypothetical protein